MCASPYTNMYIYIIHIQITSELSKAQELGKGDRKVWREVMEEEEIDKGE
jgi:hypothetical protein